MKKSVILSFVRGLLTAYAISAVLLIVLAFLIYQWSISEEIVRGGILTAYVLSCFFGGILVSRSHTGKRYLWGMAAGVLYYAILLLVSFVWRPGDMSGAGNVFPVLFLCLSGGMLGGMTQAGKL